MNAAEFSMLIQQMARRYPHAEVIVNAPYDAVGEITGVELNPGAEPTITITIR